VAALREPARDLLAAPPAPIFELVSSYIPAEKVCFSNPSILFSSRNSGPCCSPSFPPSRPQTHDDLLPAPGARARMAHTAGTARGAGAACGTVLAGKVRFHRCAGDSDRDCASRHRGTVLLGRAAGATYAVLRHELAREPDLSPVPAARHLRGRRPQGVPEILHAERACVCFLPMLSSYLSICPSLPSSIFI
jgi:hypothetical protein